MIKTLFFDIYQTLLDVDVEEKNKDKAWEVFENYLIQLGVEQKLVKQFKDFFEEEERIFYQNKDKRLYHHDLVENITSIFSKHYKVNISYKTAKDLLWEFRQVSCAYCKPDPNVRETLEELSKKYILATASLAHASMAIVELENLDLAKYFKFLLFTSRVGYRKPSEQFFREILRITNARANESIMIGDNLYQDIEGGKKVGMYTIWVKNTLTLNFKPTQPRITPDRIVAVEYINSLPSIIKELEKSQLDKNS